jgi:hypothetical protein
MRTIAYELTVTHHKKHWIELSKPTRYLHCWNMDPFTEPIITIGPFHSVMVKFQTIVADGNEVAFCSADGYWRLARGKFANKPFSNMMVAGKRGEP